ncbi:MAG: hypothetical protein ACOVSW_05500, partial [Candidatus Kapaibacteriota bacterium]
QSGTTTGAILEINSTNTYSGATPTYGVLGAVRPNLRYTGFTVRTAQAELPVFPTDIRANVSFGTSGAGATQLQSGPGLTYQFAAELAGRTIVITGG